MRSQNKDFHLSFIVYFLFIFVFLINRSVYNVYDPFLVAAAQSQAAQLQAAQVDPNQYRLQVIKRQQFHIFISFFKFSNVHGDGNKHTDIRK